MPDLDPRLDLVPALASGFVPVGALRIWLHGS